MAGSDVLSQSEIDELLSALTQGVVSAEEIQEHKPSRQLKVYDFKRPDKFSKDQIRTIYMMHENFARLANTYLSGSLRTMVYVNVASVDQLTYEEFIRSLPDPSVINIFQMRPLKGNVILEINPNIIFAIIDRLCGGPGIAPAKARSLTDIEEILVKRMVGKLLENLQEAWKQVIVIEPKIEGIETNPQFTQIVPPNDMVVIITLQTKVGQVEGLINICLPYLVLEPIMSKLTTTFWVASSLIRSASDETMNLVQRKLANASVQLTVELGRAALPMDDVINMKVGDVFSLATQSDEELMMFVGNIPKEKFRCKPGLSGNKMAVQITRVVTREGDDEEDE